MFNYLFRSNPILFTPILKNLACKTQLPSGKSENGNGNCIRIVRCAAMAKQQGNQFFTIKLQAVSVM